MEWMTATEARRRLDSGDMSAAEYCKAILQHIHKANSSVNAIVALRDEAAIAEAEAADSIPVAERGLLHGIPFTVKDTCGTGDMVTTNICFGGKDLQTAFITCSMTGRLISCRWPRAGLRLAFQEL